MRSSISILGAGSCALPGPNSSPCEQRIRSSFSKDCCFIRSLFHEMSASASSDRESNAVNGQSEALCGFRHSVCVMIAAFGRTLLFLRYGHSWLNYTIALVTHHDYLGAFNKITTVKKRSIYAVIYVLTHRLCC